MANLGAKCFTFYNIAEQYFLGMAFVINNNTEYSMAVFLNLSENIDAMLLENENQLMFKNSLRSLIQYLKSLKIYDVLRFSHLESA